MPLKDADKLKKSMERMLITGKEPDKERYTYDVVCCVIDEEPSVDAEPVRHGRWKVFYENLQEQLSGCQCSVCEYTFFGRLSDSYNFCPRCGAKMDGDKQDASN